MERPKLPNSENLEDLLEAAEGTDEVSNYPLSDDNVINFLGFYNIQPGTKLVSGRVLYTLYRKWTNEPVDLHRFNFVINQYLPRSMTGFYKINKESSIIRTDLIKHIQEDKDARTKSKSWSTHFNNYLSYYGIEPGTNYIEMEILYRLYDKWVSMNGVKSFLGHRTFYEFCKIYFPNKKKIQRKYYSGINKLDIELLDKESLKNIRGTYDKAIKKK